LQVLVGCDDRRPNIELVNAWRADGIATGRAGERTGPAEGSLTAAAVTVDRTALIASEGDDAGNEFGRHRVREDFDEGGPDRVLAHVPVAAILGVGAGTRTRAEVDIVAPALGGDAV